MREEMRRTDSAQPVTPEQRLVEAKNAALEGQTFLTDTAQARFRALVEGDLELVMAVIGEAQWKRLCAEKLRQLFLSAHGRLMRQAQEPRQPRDPKAAIRAELGVLNDYRVNGKPLGSCTRRELVEAQQAAVTRAHFLFALCALLPAEDAVVKDHVSAQQAEALLDSAGNAQ